MRRISGLLSVLLCVFLSIFCSSSVNAEDQAVTKAPDYATFKFVDTMSAKTSSVTEPKGGYYRPGDIWIGAFIDKHESGNKPRGLWGVGTFYPLNYKDGDKTHSFGVALEGNYWNGVVEDGYYYYGNRYAIDLAYRLLRPLTNFEVRVGYGRVGDWGHIDTQPVGKYVSDQTSDIITGYVGYEVRREETRLFSRARFYASADYDIDQDKTDEWVAPDGVEWPLNGDSSNKTMYSLGIDGSIYDLTKTVSLAGGLSLTHYNEGSSTGLRASAGLDFDNAKDILIGGIRVNYTDWSHGDNSVGLSAYYNLAKF